MKRKLLYFLLMIYSINYAQIPQNGLIAQYKFDASNTVLDDGVISPINLSQTFESTVLGIKDHALVNNLGLYPNPVTNILTIQLEETIEKVDVFYLFGTKVLEDKKAALNVQI